ncbi:hypothetical protein BH10BAC5_BH10BAC5_16600 [soil metagenome]
MLPVKLFRQDNNSGNYPPPPPPPPSQYNPVPPPPPPPPLSYGNNPSGMQGGQMEGSASSNSILALVLGIAAWVIGCSILTAIPAWIIGKKELRLINEGRSPHAGKTMATIGMWLGIVNCIIVVLFGIIMVILLIAGVLNSSSFNS